MSMLPGLFISSQSSIQSSGLTFGSSSSGSPAVYCSLVPSLLRNAETFAFFSGVGFLQ
jgi:hypothetical protein